MLEERGVEFRYREYRKEPLSAAEIREVLGLLGADVRDVLRKNDRVYRELGLSGTEDADVLIDLMAEHPTLLQRPIGVANGRAAVGRPIENLLGLVEGHA